MPPRSHSLVLRVTGNHVSLRLGSSNPPLGAHYLQILFEKIQRLYLPPKNMANTNVLIVGGILFIGGILTIPILIGCFIVPLGCLVILIGLVSSNPSLPRSVVVVQQDPRTQGLHPQYAQMQYAQPQYTQVQYAQPQHPPPQYAPQQHPPPQHPPMN